MIEVILERLAQITTARRYAARGAVLEHAKHGQRFEGNRLDGGMTGDVCKCVLERDRSGNRITRGILLVQAAQLAGKLLGLLFREGIAVEPDVNEDEWHETSLTSAPPFGVPLGPVFRPRQVAVCSNQRAYFE